MLTFKVVFIADENDAVDMGRFMTVEVSAAERHPAMAAQLVAQEFLDSFKTGGVPVTICSSLVG